MEPHNLTGIRTTGSPDGWVELYEVEYKTKGEPWIKIRDINNKPKLFSANYDATTPVTTFFDLPIRAQFIKIKPKSWHMAIVLQCEILGCEKDLDPGEFHMHGDWVKVL